MCTKLYFTCIEAVNMVNLVQKVTVELNVKCHFNYTYLCMTPHSVDSRSA